MKTARAALGDAAKDDLEWSIKDSNSKSVEGPYATVVASTSAVILDQAKSSTTSQTGYGGHDDRQKATSKAPLKKRSRLGEQAHDHAPFLLSPSACLCCADCSMIQAVLHVVVAKYDDRSSLNIAKKGGELTFRMRTTQVKCDERIQDGQCGICQRLSFDCKWPDTEEEEGESGSIESIVCMSTCG